MYTYNISIVFMLVLKYTDMFILSGHCTNDFYI